MKKFRYISSGLILIDRNGIIKYTNTNIEKIFGYKSSDLIGDSIMFLIPEYIKESHKKYLKDFNETKSVIMGKKRQIKILNKTGDSLEVDIILNIEVINNREYVLINISFYNDNLVQFKRLFDNVCREMFSIVSTQGYFMEVNEIFRNILEYTEEEIISKPFFFSVHPSDLIETLEAFKKIINKEVIRDFQNRYITKSGKILTLKWWGYMYENKILFITRDVTEDTKKKEELNDSKMLSDEAEKLGKYGCWKWEINGDQLIWTDGLKNIFDINEINYINYKNCLHEDDRDMVLKRIHECMANKSSYEIIHRIVVDHKVKYLKALGKYVKYHDKEYIIGVASDITQTINKNLDLQNEKKLAENFQEIAENASKEKTIFLANMSHEIRTPINAIMGMSTLMNLSELSTEQVEYNNIIKDSCGILLSLINNILQISKIDIGKDEVIMESINMNEFLLNLKTIYEKKVMKKRLRFNINTVNVCEFIETDKTKLQQIISNLLDNSIKFTNDGLIELKITCEESQMIIEVVDTGIGITEENQKKLFKPFTQADSTTTKEFGGTGLGLAICSKLVTLLNGNISMKSVFGEGTCIKVEIPFKKLSNLIIQHYKKKKGIYIVEDNRSNQIVLSKYLQKLKIEYSSIFIYDNGHEIIIDIDNIDPILIFMDLHMPKMNGIDTTIELRKHGIKCPIISVTANSMSDIGEKCRIAGMNNMILKPYSLNDISKILVDYTIL